MAKITEIENLIRARYDFIYINTAEEVRVNDELLNLARELDYNLAVWTFSSGLRTLVVDNSKINKVSSEKLDGDPVGILNHIRTSQENTIYVLNNYHSFLQDVEVARTIKDTLQFIKDSYTPIVITSPVTKVPVELEKDVVIVDFDLPDEEVIRNIIKTAEDNLEIELKQEELPNIIDACKGLTATEIQNVISRSIIECGKINPKVILTEKKQIIKKNNILEYIEPEETMNNIGGIKNLKEWLTRRGAAFTKEAREFGLPMPKGLMLTGVPGCGKSTVCKAVANLWGMPLLKLDMGAIMNSLVGASEENMRKVLQTATAVQPCVLWIDEIEKGLSGTKSSNFSDGGTTSRVFATFLTYLSDKNDSVFVIATANDITSLPSELLRKGRFDNLFFIDLPNEIERAQIFKIHLEKRGRDPKKFNLNDLAEASEGFSGAEIEQSIVDALFDVFIMDAGSVDITTDNILTALNNQVPLSKTKEKDIRELRKQAEIIAKPAN